MKVLIISHNPTSTYQSMGKTFVSLFSEFDKKELCQLYLYPTIPDIDYCNSYYRITDKDVMKSYFHFGRVESREVLNDEIDTTKHEKFENKKDEKLYNKKKKYSTMLIRDLMWKCARYYNKSLKNWIIKEKPTCIFLAPGEAKFIYDLAMRISKDYNIPIVTYICDEFYFVEKKKQVMGQLQLSLLQHKIEQLMKVTKKNVVICDSLKEQYTKKFNVPAITIMTGSNYSIAQKITNKKEVSSITYMGNLAYKRYESIAEIGKVLDEINEEHDLKYRLKLYTGNLSEEAQKAFSCVKSIEYCGYVTGDAFRAKFEESDILLHTESFDKECIDRVKNSISTKIADSLGSGIPLLAYGPDNIASIEYLINNKCAYVILNKAELKKGLMKLMIDSELRNEISDNGIKIASINHTSSCNSMRLREMIDKEIGEKGK